MTSRGSRGGYLPNSVYKIINILEPGAPCCFRNDEASCWKISRTNYPKQKNMLRRVMFKSRNFHTSPQHHLLAIIIIIIRWHFVRTRKAPWKILHKNMNNLFKKCWCPALALKNKRWRCQKKRNMDGCWQRLLSEPNPLRSNSRHISCKGMWTYVCVHKLEIQTAKWVVCIVYKCLLCGRGTVWTPLVWEELLKQTCQQTHSRALDICYRF